VTVAELIPMLQIAVGPVVLLSGVGLIIMSLTNRLGRVIDRGRILADEQRTSGTPRPHAAMQLKILARRSQLLQRAIFFSVLCMLFASLLIIALFFIAALKVEAVWLIGSLFIGALGSLILALLFFLQELNQALVVFRLDIGRWD
jgi:hypothetical protein